MHYGASSGASSKFKELKMSSLAEKFQITIPYKEEACEDANWTSFQSQRSTESNLSPELGTKFNRLPTTGLEAPCADFVQGWGGNTDVSSTEVKGESINNPKCLARGFVRREMGATDDQYSGEGMDLFYGDVIDEKGRMSFVERNNYLDRL
jgi:hypothetical protein